VEAQQQLHQREQLERYDVWSLNTGFWWAIQLERIVKSITRARGSFFARKRSNPVDWRICGPPDYSASESSALDRLYAIRRFMAIQDLICDFVVRRGTVREGERRDVLSCFAPTRTRWTTTTRRGGRRLFDAFRFLPLIGFSLLLAMYTGTLSFRPIDR
jgi:hypothetical protein